MGVFGGGNQGNVVKGVGSEGLRCCGQVPVYSEIKVVLNFTVDLEISASVVLRMNLMKQLLQKK